MTVEVSPPADYELAFIQEAMNNLDAELAAKHDLESVALDALPFTGGEPVLRVTPRPVKGEGRAGLSFAVGS